MNCASKAEKCVKKRHVRNGRPVVTLKRFLFIYPKECIELHNVMSCSKIRAFTLQIKSN